MKFDPFFNFWGSFSPCEIRIQIQQLKLMRIHADPDPKPWIWLNTKYRCFELAPVPDLAIFSRKPKKFWRRKIVWSFCSTKSLYLRSKFPTQPRHFYYQHHFGLWLSSKPMPTRIRTCYNTGAYYKVLSVQWGSQENARYRKHYLQQPDYRLCMAVNIFLIISWYKRVHVFFVDESV